jgi:hypothetical protein
MSHDAEGCFRLGDDERAQNLDREAALTAGYL